MRLRISLYLLTTAILSASAGEPSGYYSSCEGKTGQVLLQSLEDVIGPHTTISYSGLWTVYETSDVRPNGTIWDMYSTKEWRAGSEQCGNYSSVGDCYNREHSFPKSWFDDASPMYSDAFHIYPTDGKVNGQRSNYPYGECAEGTTLSASGGIKALGRLGTSTFPGYSGTVFEPYDEYKGDFARSYFYMAACYNSHIDDWSSPMLAGNSYPAYTSWAVNLLLKWHRQDPVSQKELNRNEVIYGYQDNRNPFIDHPELAEYIWGDKVGESWNLNITDEPTINTPIDGTTIDMGTTAVGIARTVTITVKGMNLADDVTIAISGSGFSVNAASLSASDVNSENGSDITITYLSTTATTATGTLTATSGTAQSCVALTATAVDGLPAQPATDITETSFVAHWIDIDQDPSARYTLNVYHNGTLISDEYPLTVLASDMQYEVTDLSPATTYTYTISSATLISDEISVTTATPIPLLQLYSDEPLSFASQPDQASDAVEIQLWSENINSDITITVGEPFAISSDMSAWSNILTLSSSEDRFYLRLQPTAAGSYTALLSAEAGDCHAESLDLTASVSAPNDFLEDFEADATGMSDYNPSSTYIGTAAEWQFSDAGIWTSDDALDSQSVRFGKTSSSYIETVKDITTGIGTVTLSAQRWNNDADATLAVQASADQGMTWTTAGTISITDNSQFVEFSVTVNIAGSARLRLQQTAGKRFNLDNVAITPYTSALTGIEIATATAYCHNGNLVIDNAAGTPVAIHSIDGITHYAGIPTVDRLTLPLPPGLYIVVIADTSRRVLIRQ